MSVYFLPDRDEGQLDWVNRPFHSLLSEKNGGGEVQDFDFDVDCDLVWYSNS